MESKYVLEVTENSYTLSITPLLETLQRAAIQRLQTKIKAGTTLMSITVARKG